MIYFFCESLTEGTPPPQHTHAHMLHIWLMHRVAGCPMISFYLSPDTSDLKRTLLCWPYWKYINCGINFICWFRLLAVYSHSIIVYSLICHIFLCCRFDTYFYKVFKVYTELWKFQQENRQKLVEGGLKRWEIGEIASRIAQLYFGQYMRTSEASYLLESYVFYEAILTREYFKEGLYQDLNLSNKQLRSLARFITVCLLLNRRHMVHQLVNHLKMLLDECKRTFQVITLNYFCYFMLLLWGS